MTKPSLPQGTRDFGPDVVRKRNYILQTIKDVFELYGFQPLETPAMENIETLMGKYGEEGDKLIFRVLDSGNPFTDNFFIGLWEYLKDFNEEVNKKNPGTFPGGGPLGNWDLLGYSPAIISSLAQDLFDDPSLNKKYLSKFKNELASKALKYDLTIPFARYVAMNHNKLTFPYKRYQIQPVWRADRPQKGRYREFYQCDADIVGSNSLLNEVELINIYTTVFEKLGIDVEIRINSKKVLFSLAIAVERLGYVDAKNDFWHAVDENRNEGFNIITTIITTAIDKVDKIGFEGVRKELIRKGISEPQLKLIFDYLEIKGNNYEKIDALKKLFSSYRTVWSPSEDPYQGIEEIYSVLDFFKSSTILSNIVVDNTLARGLNYYTGIIFEIKAKNVQIGSISGGGRYDDLTGLFGVPGIPGVGISFGVDRIYDVMEELNLFPAGVHVGTQVLFFNLGEAESRKAFELLQQLRKNGIRSELYHEATKFDKQFKYAEKKNIPYIVIIGEKELQEGNCNLKELATGQQQTIPMKDLANFQFKK